MTIVRHIVTKKITAAFFIALMLFINVIKVFHRHSTSHSVSAKNSYAQQVELPKVLSNRHCNICEFNFAKNADVAIIDIAPFEIHWIKIDFKEKPTTELPNQQFPPSGRDPPYFI